MNCKQFMKFKQFMKVSSSNVWLKAIWMAEMVVEMDQFEDILNPFHEFNELGKWLKTTTKRRIIQFNKSYGWNYWNPESLPWIQSFREMAGDNDKKKE